MRGKIAAAVGSLLVSLGLSNVASAALLVDFRPDPSSPTNYEASWSGSSLGETPAGPNGGGMIGTGDGVAAVANPASQTIGGLQIATPFKILSIPGSYNNLADGSTTFYDVTMRLTGFSAGAAANINAIPGTGITVISQPIAPTLREARFTLIGTDGQTQLLTGTIQSAVMVGIQGQATAGVQSTTVHYDGGAIFNALMAVDPLNKAEGSLSWSLLDLTSAFNTSGANVAAFDANMTGLFSANQIPEPASLGLLGLAAIGLLRRSRK